MGWFTDTRIKRKPHVSASRTPMSREQQQRLRKDIIMMLGTKRKTMKYEAQAKKIKASGDPRPLKHIIADLSLAEMNKGSTVMSRGK